MKLSVSRTGRNLLKSGGICWQIKLPLFWRKSMRNWRECRYEDFNNASLDLLSAEQDLALQEQDYMFCEFMLARSAILLP